MKCKAKTWVAYQETVGGIVKNPIKEHFVLLECEIEENHPSEYHQFSTPKVLERNIKEPTGKFVQIIWKEENE